MMKSIAAVATFVAWLPACGVVAALVVTGIAGCALDSVEVDRCRIAGQDITEFLHSLSVMSAMLGLLAVPFACVMTLGWGLYALLLLRRRRRA